MAFVLLLKLNHLSLSLGLSLSPSLPLSLSPSPFPGVVSVRFEETAEGKLCLMAYPSPGDPSPPAPREERLSAEPKTLKRSGETPLVETESYSKEQRARALRKDDTLVR